MTNDGDCAYWYKRFKEEQMKAESLMKHSERVYQQGYRAGIEAMRDAVYQVICQDVDRNFFDAHYVEVVLREEAKSLLAKIEESKPERG